MPQFAADLRAAVSGDHLRGVFKKAHRISPQSCRFCCHTTAFRDLISASVRRSHLHLKIVLCLQKIPVRSTQEQFSCIHSIQPSGKLSSCCDLFTEIGNIPACMILLRHMGDHNITVIDNRFQPDHFMNWFFPYKISQSLKQLRPIFFIKIINCTVVQLVAVFHLYNFNFGQKRFF